MSSQDPFDDSGPFENRLGPALRCAGDTFEPADSEALVDGGLTRGRRRVVRRRTAAVTGSVLALALVGVGGAYGSGVLGDSGGGKSSLAGPKDPAPATAFPGGAEAGQGGQELVSILSGLLAPGKLTPSSVTGFGGPRLAHVTGVLDDGKGEAEVSVALYPAAAGQDVSPCPVNGLSKDQSCVSTDLAGGDRLTVFQGYEYPDRREETRSWRAVLLTKSGFVIDFTEYNAPAEKGAKVSRAVPPLNPKELRDLVTSAKWAGPLADLAKQPPSGPKGNPGKPKGNPGMASHGGNINKTFTSLLPKELKIIESGPPDSGYTYVVVDDGNGPTRVEINVQRGMNDVAGELFGEGTTELPGGVRLNTAKQPGEKGGVGMVMWQADTIRPDGLRVVVFETNGADQHGPASRKEPALTIGQLVKIATSSKWLTFG
ncbi:hypothetical protein [Streptomyces sp. NBC_00370]|uniref:hypothetical protein n=1 Tax=Streptomyces sp. NBC_00370 TaxID=2975728 RepID=UPI002E26B796